MRSPYALVTVRRRSDKTSGGAEEHRISLLASASPAPKRRGQRECATGSLLSDTVDAHPADPKSLRDSRGAVSSGPHLADLAHGHRQWLLWYWHEAFQLSAASCRIGRKHQCAHPALVERRPLPRIGREGAKHRHVW